MKDPKQLPNCVLVMDKILETLKSFYDAAGRGVHVKCDVNVLLDFFILCQLHFVLTVCSLSTDKDCRHRSIFP